MTAASLFFETVTAINQCSFSHASVITRCSCSHSLFFNAVAVAFMFQLLIIVKIL